MRSVLIHYDYLSWIIDRGRKMNFPAEYLSPLLSLKTCEPVVIDHTFNLISQCRRRPGSENPLMLRVYKITDRIREKIADLL